MEPFPEEDDFHGIPVARLGRESLVRRQPDEVAHGHRLFRMVEIGGALASRLVKRNNDRRHADLEHAELKRNVDVPVADEGDVGVDVLTLEVPGLRPPVDSGGGGALLCLHLGCHLSGRCGVCVGIVVFTAHVFLSPEALGSGGGAYLWRGRHGERWVATAAVGLRQGVRSRSGGGCSRGDASVPRCIAAVQRPQTGELAHAPAPRVEKRVFVDDRVPDLPVCAHGKGL